jgi:carbonic anhydrase
MSRGRPTRTSNVDEFVSANRAYARDFRLGDLRSPPRRRVAVVTCMDARLLPSRFLGLEEGDAHVIRNAGGSAREALRSLAVSQHLLGTDEIVLIRHTDCGMAQFTSEQIASRVAEASGGDPSGIDFMAFSDVEQAVEDDVEFLRASDLIAPDTLIWGFVYDVKTGALTAVA